MMNKSEAGKLGNLKSQVTKKIQKEERLKAYNENPKLCKGCGRALIYEKRKNSFCNHSCFASYNNREVRRNFIEGRDYHKTYCINCGILITPNKKYCSIKCQREYQYQTNIQKWKNGETTGCKGSTGTSNYIKRYMIGKAEGKCELCGWGEINPYNKRIPLELHHKDGDFTNNNEENLQILCPNCHSLTDNYKNTGSRESKRVR